MEGYSVKIKETSRQLTAKERIMFKDTSDCIKLDIATDGEAVIINPAFYVILEVHNEKSDNKDYEQYVIVDKDGTKYATGSNSFWTSFMDIFNEMADNAPDEDYSIKAYKMESKNYKGKAFITCSIL